MNKGKTTPAKQVSAVSFLQVALVTMFAGVFFGVVSPTPASSLAVIGGSITLGALMYVWFALSVRLFTVFWQFSIPQQRVLAGALTVTTMFLIMMQSIGELSWRDAFAAIPLVAITYTYATYTLRERTAQTR